LKLAMIRVDKAIAGQNLDAAMLLTVHDELVFEVSEAAVEPMKALVKDIMENIWELKVPLKVNVTAGDNWAEAH